jgi:uncharacterized protein YndB with AHSA1/START domain
VNQTRNRVSATAVVWRAIRTGRNHRTPDGPGGRERLKGRWGGRVGSTFDATYYDMIENERLVYCYEIHLDDRKISVSVATLQLQADGNGPGSW